MSTSKKPARSHDEELSALIQIREAPKKTDDTTGKIDRVELERAEKTARGALKMEHRARKRPPVVLILGVLAVATLLGWLAAQLGWF